MEYIRAGELVPDSIMIQVLEERLRNPDSSDGFILDGYPRTLSQARYLGIVLKRLKREIDAVVNIEVDRQLILDRLSIRQRTDDDPKTVQHRLDVYHRETEPLIDFYQREKLLRQIDGDASPEAVTERILERIIESPRG